MQTNSQPIAQTPKRVRRGDFKAKKEMGLHRIPPCSVAVGVAPVTHFPYLNHTRYIHAGEPHLHLNMLPSHPLLWQERGFSIEETCRHLRERLKTLREWVARKTATQIQPILCIIPLTESFEAATTTAEMAHHDAQAFTPFAYRPHSTDPKHIPQTPG